MSVGISRGGDALFRGYQPPAAVCTQDVDGLLDLQGLQVGVEGAVSSKGFKVRGLENFLKVSIRI
jgi:hypothetical protein